MISRSFFGYCSAASLSADLISPEMALHPIPWRFFHRISHPLLALNVESSPLSCLSRFVAFAHTTGPEIGAQTARACTNQWYRAWSRLELFTSRNLFLARPSLSSSWSVVSFIADSECSHPRNVASLIPKSRHTSHCFSPFFTLDIASNLKLMSNFFRLSTFFSDIFLTSRKLNNLLVRKSLNEVDHFAGQLLLDTSRLIALLTMMIFFYLFWLVGMGGCFCFLMQISGAPDLRINGAPPLFVALWSLIVPPAPVLFNWTGYMYFTRDISNIQD